ncbi:MAG: transposase [Bacteroidota bacterium]
MPEKFRNKYRIQSARLQGYDYRNAGAYFITICTQHRNHYFGECENKHMQLSPLGLLAEQFWFEIPNHFPNTSLDAFVVMPNHIHGILVINEKWENPRNNGSPVLPVSPISSVETHNYASLPATEYPATEYPATEYPATEYPATELNNIHSPKNEYFQNLSAPAKSVSTIMRAYKSVVTIESRKIDTSFGWQPRFHDHIIRNPAEYERIANYIGNNPSNWKEDRFF